MFEEMMGTKPVSERQRFDVDALGAYLRAHIPGFPDGAIDGRAVQGRPVESDLQAISAGGQHYVLRTKPGPAAKLLPSAHAIDREYRVMDALQQGRLPGRPPVPAVHRRSR